MNLIPRKHFSLVNWFSHECECVCVCVSITSKVRSIIIETENHQHCLKNGFHCSHLASNEISPTTWLKRITVWSTGCDECVYFNNLIATLLWTIFFSIWTLRARSLFFQLRYCSKISRRFRVDVFVSVCFYNLLIFIVQHYCKLGSVHMFWAHARKHYNVRPYIFNFEEAISYCILFALASIYIDFIIYTHIVCGQRRMIICWEQINNIEKKKNLWLKTKRFIIFIMNIRKSLATW